MKVRKSFVLALSAIASLSLGSHEAGAEMLYDGVGFLEGTQSFTDTFSLASPGTLTVTLADLGWPAPLASLDLLVSSPSGALGPEMGPGTAMFDVSSGNITAQWFGTAASGGLNTGAYSLEIQFAPTAVPLPTSIVLLLSGLALLIWQRRTRAGGGELEPRGRVIDSVS